jgi:hypothetical protein
MFNSAQLTAASMLAGDSSVGSESMETTLMTIVCSKDKRSHQTKMEKAGFFDIFYTLFLRV